MGGKGPSASHAQQDGGNCNSGCSEQTGPTGPHQASQPRSAGAPGPSQTPRRARGWLRPGAPAGRWHRAQEATGVLTQAGPAIRVEPEAGLALTEVGAWRVHTPVLAAAVVHLALVHVCMGTRGRGSTARTHPGRPPSPCSALAPGSPAWPPSLRTLPPPRCWGPDLGPSFSGHAACNSAEPLTGVPEQSGDKAGLSPTSDGPWEEEPPPLGPALGSSGGRPDLGGQAQVGGRRS